MKLKAPAANAWLIPCTGLRILMRPVSTPVMVEARHLFRELAEAELPKGPEGQIIPDAKLPRERVQYLMTVSMIAAGAVEWDGLENEDGEELAHPDLAQIRQLLDAEPHLFDALDDQYCVPLYLLMAEKKGSRLSLNTTSPMTAPGSAEPATEDTATPKTPAHTMNTGQ